MKLNPKTTFQKWSAGEFLFDMGAAVAALVVGLGSAARALKAGEIPIAQALAAGTALAVVVMMWRAVAKNRKAQQTTERNALDGVLHALHAILVHAVGKASNGHSLRVCVFVPNGEGIVHQLTDYVGDDQPRGAGRDISSRCGVVGRAFRSGEAQYDKLPKNTVVMNHLVAEYGFSRQEANDMRRDRQSWAAIPVGAPESVIAVIYLDSAEPGFFQNSNGLRRKTLEAAVLGVAEFVNSG